LTAFPKPPKRVRDRDHLLRVKRLPCAVVVDWWPELPKPPPCAGVTEAAHVGRRARGRKCDDAETIPLCQRHHRMLDDCIGGSLFPGVPRELRREWLAAQVNRVQTELRQSQDPGIVPF